MRNQALRGVKNDIKVLLFSLLGGALFLTIGILMLGSKDNNTPQYVKTTATITEVNFESRRFDFTYTVEGKQYTGSSRITSGTYEVGGKMKIYYNVNNPGAYSLSPENSGQTGYFFIGGAVCAFAVGILAIVQKYRKKWTYQSFPPITIPPREELEEYTVTFTGTFRDPSYVVRDKYGDAVYEWRKVKHIPFKGTVFSFTNHRTSRTKEHVAGRLRSTASGNIYHPTPRTWFKLDGRDIWELLRKRGVSTSTEVEVDWPPKVTYTLAQNDSFFGIVESEAVRDEDGNVKIISGGSNYRCWTAWEDLDLLGLIVFTVFKIGNNMAE